MSCIHYLCQKSAVFVVGADLSAGYELPVCAEHVAWVLEGELARTSEATVRKAAS